MAQKPQYVYQHYPKQVKHDDLEKADIVVNDAREHYKLAKNDFLQDEVAQEMYEPPTAAEESNLLQLKAAKKAGRPPLVDRADKTDIGA